MDHASHDRESSDRPLRIPPMVWFLAAGLLAALVAMYVFAVPLSRVGYYGLFAFFIGSHFFMHGSHAGHGTRDSTAAGAASSSQDEHAGHSGGCH